MSAQISVHVAGSERSVAEGTTYGDLLEGDRTVLVARVGGELRDLHLPAADGDVVEPVTAAEQDGLDVLRHSAAHVLAQAVQELHPDAKLGIGPPIRDGFYYDFDVETPFTPEDLKALEKVMQRIVNEGQAFRRREVSDEDAAVELADEPYKIELIGLKGGAAEDAAEGAEVEVGGAQLTIYDNVRRDGSVAWGDLCRGPHVPTTKVLGNAFKLMRSAAAYWRGSEKNPQLQRVYGTAWPTKDELKAYLERLAEAEKRDHRKLGAELDLYSFPDELGSGMVVFHPRGGVIKREMEDYVRRRHIEEGFQYVGTPHISKAGLFHTSGHLPVLRRHDVPPDGDGALGVPPQGDELPDAQPHLPLARTLLPRAAAAPLRVRLGLPQREVGRGPRADARAGDDPGRLALLRHRRAGAGRDRAPAALRRRPARGLRARRLLLRAVDPRHRGREEGQVHRLRRAVGGGHRGPRGSPPRSSVSTSSTTPAARRSTARRSRCRPGTPSGAPGRCRPSSTTSTSRTGSASSTRRPTARARSR